MKLYLAGPMSGIEAFNFPAFHAAAAALRAHGFEVFSPAEEDVKRGEIDLTTSDNGWQDDPDHRRRALAHDYEFIALHADGVALLPGCRESSGALSEIAVASAVRIPSWPVDRWLTSDHALVHYAFQVTGEAVGAGSACWTQLSGAGEFRAEVAEIVVKDAAKAIVERMIELRDAYPFD